MKVLKFILIVTAIGLIIANLNVSKSDSSFFNRNMLIKIAVANAEDPPPQDSTVNIIRKQYYDCYFWVGGTKNGCGNCAWECEPETFPADNPPSQNCWAEKTCCVAIPIWETLFGPC